MKSGMLHIFIAVLILAAGCARHHETPDLNRDDDEALPPMNYSELSSPAVSTLKAPPQASKTHRSLTHIIPERNTMEPGTIAENGQKEHLPSTPALKARIAVRDEFGGKSLKTSAMEPDDLVFFKKGRSFPGIHAGFIFDNDIWDYTDYYYTSGIGLEFYHPALTALPVSRILPGLRESVNHYGLILQHFMYTPLKLDKYSVQLGDRPFAACLTLEYRKISLSPGPRRRLETSVTAGVIGPAALGGIAQEFIHDDEPVGWVNQVKNDFILNYSARFEQGIIGKGRATMGIFGAGQAGTLYDNLKAGLVVQFSNGKGRYEDLFLTTEGDKPLRERVRYFLTLDLESKWVIYDATLMGGMMNGNSVYTLERSQVKPIVFTGKAGIGIGLGRYSLEIEQVFLSPEFDGGRRHLWIRIRNLVYLN